MAFAKSKLAAVVLVVNKDREVLLVRNHWRGWDLPGGYVESKEFIAFAAVREVKEETGIDAEIIRFCGVEYDIKEATLAFIYFAQHIAGELRISNESYDIGYFPANEAIRRIKSARHKERIELCLSESNFAFLREF